MDDPVTVQGRVLDGPVVGALVCLDHNGNGRCDGAEPRSTSDQDGRYVLTVPRGSTAPLLAEVPAGQARTGGPGGPPVDRSYRLASPSADYGTDITPRSTVVHAAHAADPALAEDLARAQLGLPPRHVLRPAAAPAAGSADAAVAEAVVAALKALGDELDLSSADALARLGAALPPALNTLPQLRIDTRGAAPIVSKEVYVDAVFTLGRLARPAESDVINGRVRGRGNTTWDKPKNPYKLQFSNDASYARVPDVLGMKKNRNWALLADWFDRSLMRNQLALSLGNSAAFRDGLRWSPSGQHVEVWLNGDYVGVYLLTEDIRIDAARLDLHKMSTAAAGTDIDGGYIVEVDQRLDCYKGDDLDLQLVTGAGVPICIDTPDEGAITPRQLAYIKAELQRTEDDLYGPRRLDRLHRESFVDWYLLQELLRNNDGQFYSSDFLWKDGSSAADPADRLLHMGPLWDFDRAAGNVNYNGNWQVEGCWVSKGDRPNWYAALFQNPEFLDLTLQRWKAKRRAIEDFVRGGTAAFERRLQGAQQRNFDRWPILREPLESFYVFGSHAEEVAFLRQFLLARMMWLDLAFDSPGSFRALCQ
ncbi:MAG: CotH kinase family protein [Rubrivivax sp.]